MNDKDKEAFDKWHYENISNPPTINDLITKAWSNACEYKQKEIDDLLAENAKLKKEIDESKSVIYWTVEQNGKVTRHISIAEIEKLQTENERLKEVMSYQNSYSAFLHEKEMAQKIQKLQAENAKLKKVLCFYANGYASEVDDSCNSYFKNGHIRLSSGKRARQCLKELDEKL